MKKLIFIFAIFTAVACSTHPFDVDKAKEALDFSAKQYKLMMASLPDSLMPRYFKNDTLHYGGIYWWCSGFYPGTCWYLYEHTNDEAFLKEAEKRTMMLEPIKYVTDNHDLGFMLYCSFGNGYRITGNEKYKSIMDTGAISLASRYHEATKCIKSWDFQGPKNWQYPVIIDNMMNLEFLMWASREFKNNNYNEISINHANTTMIYHYRDDYSCVHVVDYDSISGEVRQRVTHQGFSDESSWARGQAWGLYGYTMMYRETKDTNYLVRANQIANFLLKHPRMPADLVAYWDLDAPKIPNEPRDASTAAIMASALIELSTFADPVLSKTYMMASEIILSSLTSSAYRAKEGENGNFILMHSVGSLPHNSEVDVPLTYADYYYVEALLRYLKVKGDRVD